MPRIARMFVKGEPAVYHVMTRMALDGYVFGDVENYYLFKLIQKLSSIYFTELIWLLHYGKSFSLVSTHEPRRKLLRR